jgi:polyphosphate kinase
MGRNLDRRIEVAFPIQDPDRRKEVMDMLELQWRDNVKARLLNSAQDNPYRKAARAEARVQAQQAIHSMLAARTR